MLQPNNPFDQVNRSSAINYLQCNGDESQLSDCDINTEIVDTCGQYAIAGVVCQGKLWCYIVDNDCFVGSQNFVTVG